MPDENTEVTYVGGIAVEQNEGLDSNLEVDEREAAKEAVRKAIAGEAEEVGKEAAKAAKTKKASPFKPEGMETDDGSDDRDVSPKHVKATDAAPERGPDGKFLPKEGKPAKEPAEVKDEEEQLDLDKASVKQLLKAREKVAALKRDAKSEVEQARAEFEQQRAAFQRQQQEFQYQQQQIAKQYQTLQRLKSDPASAVRDIGLDPEKFILDLAEEGSPEGMAKRQYRELQAQINEMKAWKDQQAKQYEEQKRQQQYDAVVHARQTAVADFVKLGTDDEKYPLVSTFYKGHERSLVARGDIAAQEYRELSGGKEGSYEDILDYIEDQLAERASSWYSKKHSDSTGSQKVETPKAKSKGKSLSPNGSGERRSLQPKSLKDLDGDERLEAARQAVSVALANSKD